MSLLTVSLLIEGLILLVNSSALVKNEKKPFVLVQTGRSRMNVQALGAGQGGVGASAPLARLPGLATPCPGGGQRVEGRLDSQSAGVCLRLLRVEVGHVCVELRA